MSPTRDRRAWTGFSSDAGWALAPMAGAMASTVPPAGGDLTGRRALWEPIIGAAAAAQPLPADVTTSEHHATADDGTRITMRWYAEVGAIPGSAVLFFHGSGYARGGVAVHGWSRNSPGGTASGESYLVRSASRS
ncbi:hypothetical protein AB0J80_06395 [Actinoplanes sp. NPDC049548]|uniref:hypothetical protein n=1 Tax=Actinoplanes sp. NPDC049548 TaxID=3155152 RepID=UPI0034336FF4